MLDHVSHDLAVILFVLGVGRESKSCIIFPQKPKEMANA